MQRPLVCVVVAALALVAAACSGAGAPAAKPAPESKPAAAAAPTAAPASRSPAAAAQPTAAPARAKVEYMMIIPIVNYWHQYVAQEQGFFDQQNLDVEFSYSENSSKLVQALASGSINLGGPSPDAVINAVEHGSNLAFVGGEVNKMAYTLVAAKDVKTYADLKGKTMAVIGVQEGSTVVLKKMLADHGLHPDDYSLVPVGGTANRAAAVQNGTAGAALIGQPQDFRMTADGYTNLGNSYDVFPYYPLDVITARRDWAQRNADVVVRYLRAIVQADRWIYDPSNREAAANVAVKVLKMTEDEALRSYDLLVTQTQAIPRDAELPVNGIQTVIDTMMDIDLLSAPAPPPDKYVDQTYLERAQR